MTELKEAVARAVIASEGAGHNDPPTFDDLTAEEQKFRLMDAEVVIEALKIQRYEIRPVEQKS